MFKSSAQHKQVGIPDHHAFEMKYENTIGFKPSSQYYLRLPNEKYLNMILFLLLVPEEQFTKNARKCINSFSEGTKDELMETYWKNNNKRDRFCAVRDLQKFSQRLNYHEKLFEEGHDKFTQKVVMHPINQYKNQQKVLIIYVNEKPEKPQSPFGEQQKLQGHSEALVIKKEEKGEGIFIGAFSGSSGSAQVKLQEPVKEEAAEPKKVKVQPKRASKAQIKKVDKPVKQQQQDMLQEQITLQQKKSNAISFSFSIAFMVILLLTILLAFNENFNHLVGRACRNMPFNNLLGRMITGLSSLMP